MRRSLLVLSLLAFAFMACEDDTSVGPVGNVNVSNAGFDPDSTNLTPTALSVTWGFLSGGPHNVTFEDGAPGSGDRTSGAFTRDYSGMAAGVYRYRCTNHSTSFTAGMVGVVVRP